MRSVARLVREVPQTAGQRFLASEGSMPELAAILDVPDDTEEELDEIYNNPM